MHVQYFGKVLDFQIPWKTSRFTVTGPNGFPGNTGSVKEY